MVHVLELREIELQYWTELIVVIIDDNQLQFMSHQFKLVR